MLSVSPNASSARKSIARVTLAALLMLVLLAGAVPFTSLSSSHECGMACCAGLPSHMAGSCSTALGNEEETEPHTEADDEQAAHDNHATHHSDSASQIVASAEHQETAKHPSTHHSKSGGEETARTARIASQIVTKPCSPECAAVALSYSQVRRPRDSASVAIAVKPRPPALASFVRYFSRPIPKSAERRRLSRPRAPPRLPKNLSA